MSTEADSNLPQWISVTIAATVGLFTATGVTIRMLIGLNSRMQTVENKTEDKSLQAVVRDELEHERHNVLYPMLQTRVYAALDKIEEEVKMQGQNIAVLLERDRTAAALERFGETLARQVGEAVINALKGRP